MNSRRQINLICSIKETRTTMLTPNVSIFLCRYRESIPMLRKKFLRRTSRKWWFSIWRSCFPHLKWLNRASAVWIASSALQLWSQTFLFCRFTNNLWNKKGVKSMVWFSRNRLTIWTFTIVEPWMSTLKDFTNSKLVLTRSISKIPKFKWTT